MNGKQDVPHGKIHGDSTALKQGPQVQTGSVEVFFCLGHISPRQTTTHKALFGLISWSSFLQSPSPSTPTPAETFLEPLFWKMQFPSSGLLDASLVYSVPGTVCLARGMPLPVLGRPKLVSSGIFLPAVV